MHGSRASVRSIAKITPPRLAEIYPRKRLFRLLDDARKRPVVWVSGPPGSGKTTLVKSWLDSRRLPHLWYQMDEGDADIATFFYYMGMAAKKAAPRVKRPLPLLTPEYQLGIPTFTKRYFENLYSRFNSSLPPLSPTEGKGQRKEQARAGGRRFIIVFDNYQQVPQESSFHEIIKNGLSIVPPGINIIVISRSDPPAPLIGLRANNILEVIGWEDIRLTPDESKGIVRLERERRLSNEMIVRIHDMAQGWAAGLILMTKEAQSADSVHAAFDERTPEEIFDYFANELFDKADVQIRDFLIKTAFLTQITIPMAEKITGNRHAGRILSDLNRNNYFTEKRSHPGLTYQYHALFRKFLSARAEHMLPSAEVFHLRQRAALLLEESGQVEDAAELLIDAADWERLARLILSHAGSLARQGRYSTLGKWISYTTADVQERLPWLFYWRGVSLLPTAPEKSLADFEKAFDRFGVQKDVVGLFLSWVGIVESIWYAFDDMTRLEGWINIFESLIAEHGNRAPAEIEARAASILLKLIIQTRFKSPDFERWKTRATLTRDANTRIEALLNIAAYYVFNCDIAKAQNNLRSLNILLKSFEASPLQRLQGILHEVLLYTLSGSYDRCMEAVRQGIEIADRSGVHTLDFMIVGNGLVAALNYDDPAAVAEFSARLPADSVEKMKPWERSFYHFLKAFEFVRNKDYYRARQHAHESVQYAEQVGFPASRIWSRLGLVLVLLEHNELCRAEQMLRDACSIAVAFGGTLLVVDCRFVEAHYWAERNPERALRSLKQALNIGKGKGLMTSYIPLRPDVMSRLCATALGHGIEVDYVRELIRKRNLNPPSSPFAKGGQEGIWIEHWPWPLRIYTFGRFEIQKDDKPLLVSRKAQKKPLQLLKALIALGGKDVREDRLSDLLWPDAEGDAGQKAVNVNTVRLRKLLGVPEAIVVRDGCISLDPRLCWVDARAFERMIEQAGACLDGERMRWGEGVKKIKSSRRSVTPSPVHGSLDRALSLYRGPFLADEPELWAVSLREKLRDRFLWSIETLGSYCEERKEWRQAIQYYKKGLEADELVEEFHRRIITCYQKLGRKAEAISAYNRCRKTLAAYNIEPSAETEVLKKSILKQQ